MLDEVAEDADEDERDEDAGARAVGAVLAHELEDVRIEGARAAIVDRDGRRAGDPTLPTMAPGTCDGADAWRGCTVELGGELDGATLTLAVTDARAAERLRLFLWAILIGTLTGAAAGGLTSAAVTRWALAPIASLRDRVRRIDPQLPSPDALEPAARHAEIEELRVAVADLVERLGRSLALARGFAAEAAHELRTPLSTIAAELDLAGEDRGLDAAGVARLRTRVGVLVELVQRLLVLARPGRLEGAETVDLGDVIESAVGSLPPGERARIRVDAGDDVLVRGEHALLVALLTNAIGNALKFSTDTVDVAARSVGAEAWLEVRDRGPGIPAGERQRVFEPFYRSRDARASDVVGSGVGLALIAHVATAHGGRAELLDTDRGVHLRVRMPRWTPR